MFDSLFPKHWTTLQRLMWLKTNALARAVWEQITGNPVSFTAIAAPLKQLSVAFSPVQDLHGYDAPWPAGGGKNKYGGSALKSDLLAVTGSTEGTDTNGSFVNLPASTALNNVVLFNDFAENQQYTIIFKILPTGNAASNIRVYYTDNSYQSISASADETLTTVTYTTTAGKTVASIILGYWYISTCKVYFDACGVFVGASQSYSPYSNICPISGWDSLNVEQRGKNLLPTTAQDSTAWHTGTAETGGYRYYVCDLPAGTAYFHSPHEVPYNNTLFCRIATYKADGTRVQSNDWLYHPSSVSHNHDVVAVAVPSDGYVQLEAYGNAGDAFADNLWITLAQDAPYVPYDSNSRSISLSFGSTVYSGTLDVLTGVVTVDMAKVVFSGQAGAGQVFSSVAKASSSDENYTGFLLTLANNIYENSSLILSQKALSNIAPWYYGNNNQTTHFYKNQAVLLPFIPASVATTVDEFKTYAASNSVEFVLPLVTPITIQLTPEQVNSLAGENVMWASTNGDMTIEYRSA